MVSTAAFNARVRGSVPGLGSLKETKMFLPHPRVKVSIVGSLRGREVACSASVCQDSNFESCVWRTVSSQSSHHPQEILLAQFSLYVHEGGIKPDSFHCLLGKSEIAYMKLTTQKRIFQLTELQTFCTPFIGSTESQLFETGTCVSQFQLQPLLSPWSDQGWYVGPCQTKEIVKPLLSPRSDHGDSKAFTISMVRPRMATCKVLNTYVKVVSLF